MSARQQRRIQMVDQNSHNCHSPKAIDLRSIAMVIVLAGLQVG
jgi:hypothetical protein